jgi:signal transduction histidine kinase
MTTVLVIEDDELTRENIVEGLTYSGYFLLDAPNGRVGVSLAKEHLPDLIVCDINMPEMNGYEVLMQLRAMPETSNIPFIFLTAQTDRTSMREGMKLGADDYISKPFEHHELVEAIETRLQKQQNLTQAYEHQMANLRSSIVQAIPHELRTPLMGIIGYAELMAMDAASMSGEQIQQMAEEIVRAGWRLHRTVENYLIYAQIELISGDPERTRAMAMETEKYPMAIIQSMVERTSVNHNRRINLLAQRNVEICVSGDNLSKIMIELLDNACKFSTPGTPIDVQANIYGHEFQISIENEGRGMSAEQLQQIGAYMQFGRALYEQQGLGLGLAISRRLAELHGGSFHITSVPGGRTTVYVSFPLAD